MKVLKVKSNTDSRSFIYPLINDLRKRGRVLLCTSSTACHKLYELGVYENSAAELDNVSIIVVSNELTLREEVEAEGYNLDEFEYLILDNFDDTLENMDIRSIKSIYIFGYLDSDLFYEEVVAVAGTSKDIIFVGAGNPSKEMKAKIALARDKMLEGQKGDVDVDSPEYKFKVGLSKKADKTGLGQDIIHYKTPNILDLDKFESTFKMYPYDKKLDKLFKRIQAEGGI